MYISKFLDVFSGSGIISLEAISRGFKEVLSVEKDITIEGTGLGLAICKKIVDFSKILDKKYISKWNIIIH